jgi:hypothetical protein
MTDADRCAALLRGYTVMHPTYDKSYVFPIGGEKCALCGFVFDEPFTKDVPRAYCYVSNDERRRDAHSLKQLGYIWCTEPTP